MFTAGTRCPPFAKTARRSRISAMVGVMPSGCAITHTSSTLLYTCAHLQLVGLGRSPVRHRASNLAALKPPFLRDRTEIYQWFHEEADCLSYLAAIRWQDGFSCPKCGPAEAWVAGPGLRRCKSCRKLVSVASGTLLHRTRKPVRDWLVAVWHLCVQKNGGSALGLQRSLGFGSYHTGWESVHPPWIESVLSPFGIVHQ